jgi:PAS domain S-box-containing protein
MGFFQRISLQQKQTLIIMLTSGAALLIACLTFAAYDVMTFRRGMISKLSTLAEIVGDNSIAALDFDDPQTAEETLSALRAEPSIDTGCIYKTNGEAFAVYARTSKSKTSLPHAVGHDGEYFSGRTLHLFRQIRHNNEIIGAVYVEADLGALYERLERYGIIVASVFAMSSLVALFLSGRLQKIVSGPILELVQTTRAVTREKNYSMRASKRSQDELGTLVDSFNDMLSEIQLRDTELQKATDVLEQRVEERTHELANSLSLLRATLQSTADGILVLSGDGKVTSFNEQFLRMWQIPRKVADAMERQELLEAAVKHLKDPKTFLEKIDELMGKPELESFDLLEFNDGRIFERYSKPQQIGETYVGRVWSFRDITGRKRAENILQRTEELYRRAIGGAGAVPYSYDYKTRSYLFMGEGIKQLIGYTPHEMSPGRWLKIIQESVMVGDTAGLAKSEAAKRILTGEIRNWRCDMRVLTRDGKLRWISDASVQTLDEAGKPTGSMGILQDITDRKEAEQALRERDEKFNQMAANITDVFWMRSPDLREVHYVSPAFEKIWGLSAQSHYANPEKWVEAIVPEDRERVEAAFSRLAKNAPSLDLEYRIKRPDGELRWIHVRGFQVRDSAGKVVRLTGIVTDITQRKQAEAELKAVHDQLLETSRRAGMAEVATSVLHNVGNVLNSVNVSSSLIREKIKKSRVTNLNKVAALLQEQRGNLANFFASDSRANQLPDYLSQLTSHLAGERDEMLQEVASLVRNIEHIKEIVAMQQSYAKVSGISESLFPVDLVEDALRMNAGAMERHQVQVIREFSETPPISVEKHKVLQILVNLMRNAKYALDEGKMEPKEMRLRIEKKDENFVRICVIDNGVGICEENLTRIFNHGFTTRKEGHGFGLHSGALAAKELGGALIAHSEGIGKGATFTLELPYQQNVAV